MPALEYQSVPLDQPVSLTGVRVTLSYLVQADTASLATELADLRATAQRYAVCWAGQQPEFTDLEPEVSAYASNGEAGGRLVELFHVQLKPQGTFCAYSIGIDAGTRDVLIRQLLNPAPTGMASCPA